MDYSKITDNPKVIELLKQRIEIENKIKAIDENALIKHELELLSLPDVGVCSREDCTDLIYSDSIYCLDHAYRHKMEGY
jgi:hypothetical protein